GVLETGTGRYRPPQVVPVVDVIAHRHSVRQAIRNVGQRIVVTFKLDRAHEPIVVEPDVIGKVYAVVIGILVVVDLAVIAQVIKQQRGVGRAPGQFSGGVD